MTEETKIEVEKEYEYLYFSRAYLISSIRNLDEVLGVITKKKFENPFGEITPDWVYQNNYLLVPTFYNLKHAIEIFIKTTYHLIGIVPEEKHDIKYLFKSLSKNKNLSSDLKIQLEELEGLIIKYHGNDFLLSKIEGNMKMEDMANDVFRYPDNKAKISLRFFQILPKFSAKDVFSIKEDIIKIDKLFYGVGYKILEEKHGVAPSKSELLDEVKKLNSF